MLRVHLSDIERSERSLYSITKIQPYFVFNCAISTSCWISIMTSCVFSTAFLISLWFSKNEKLWFSGQWFSSKNQILKNSPTLPMSQLWHLHLSSIDFASRINCFSLSFDFHSPFCLLNYPNIQATEKSWREKCFVGKNKLLFCSILLASSLPKSIQISELKVNWRKIKFIMRIKKEGERLRRHNNRTWTPTRSPLGNNRKFILSYWEIINIFITRFYIVSGVRGVPENRRSLCMIKIIVGSECRKERHSIRN